MRAIYPVLNLCPERNQRADLVTSAGAGVDNAWEQKKPEATKMLDEGGEFRLSSARLVENGLEGITMLVF
jgi:hypothetical protein